MMELAGPRALRFQTGLHEHLGVRRDSRASAGERESQPDHSRRAREFLTLGTLGTLGDGCTDFAAAATIKKSGDGKPPSVWGTWVKQRKCDHRSPPRAVVAPRLWSARALILVIHYVCMYVCTGVVRGAWVRGSRAGTALPCGVADPG